MEKMNEGWSAATEKSLKVTYWLVKITFTVLLAKQQGLLEWIF